MVESDQAAGEFVGDLGAAAAVLFLTAAEFLEFAFLAFEFLLLTAESELHLEVEQELIELRRASFASRDLREGMRAFAERRPANWRGE